ncbi:MAG: hypothetical protein NTW11_00095 [Candidatus Staskawiczbacteria bacterium]|nr:hypothetical protein [Candidatus Staskawiczbacteria bacterium]
MGEFKREFKSFEELGSLTDPSQPSDLSQSPEKPEVKPAVGKGNLGKRMSEDRESVRIQKELDDLSRHQMGIDDKGRVKISEDGGKTWHKEKKHHFEIPPGMDLKMVRERQVYIDRRINEILEQRWAFEKGNQEIKNAKREVDIIEMKYLTAVTEKTPEDEARLAELEATIKKVREPIQPLLDELDRLKQEYKKFTGKDYPEFALR